MTGCRRGKVGVAFVLMLALTSGCSDAPWQQAESPAPTAASSQPAPSASASVRNDLADGALKRRLSAGAVTLSVSYWSTLELAQWTPAVPKPLNVVVSGKLAGGAPGQQVFLTAVRVSTTATAPDGTVQVLADVVDTATVAPGYVITSPSSYQQVFTLPPAPDGSTSVQVSIVYELLVQSAPKATTYLRQATSDTLIIPLVP